MQEKMFKNLLIGLLIFNLAACANNLLGSKKIVSPENTNLFLDSSSAHFMGNADRNKLQNLVATAQPQQVVSWYSEAGIRFEFISKKIFVNPEGQGCRDYQINIREFLRPSTFDYTACRNSRGIWRVIPH